MYAGIKPNVIQIGTDYTDRSRFQNIAGLSFTADSIPSCICVHMSNIWLDSNRLADLH